MSLAWATVVLVVLLLPGFVFYTALFIPEGFARENVPRSAFAELATAIAVSFFLHGLAFIMLRDRIETRALLAILQVQGARPPSLGYIARALETSAAPLFGYLTAANLVALCCGLLAGKAIARFAWLRPMVQHAWVLDLRPKRTRGYLFAYVLTNVRQDDRILMYRGVLVQFGLRRDGTFAYLVLEEPTRYYMHLDQEAPRTSDTKGWRSIGAESGTRIERNQERTLTYLAVEGEDIANVVFERYHYAPPTAALERALFNDDLLGEYLRIEPGMVRWPENWQELPPENLQSGSAGPSPGAAASGSKGVRPRKKASRGSRRRKRRK